MQRRLQTVSGIVETLITRDGLFREQCFIVSKKLFNPVIALTSAANSATAVEKGKHLRSAEEFYQRARIEIEVNGDWQESGSMILKALREERKAQSTGPQVVNVIKVRPKTKLEFSFKS